MFSSRRKISSQVGGRFNSQLKKTGFLSEIKKSSKLISKNPTRFLEEFANIKEQDMINPDLESRCLELESFIEDLRTRNSSLDKETDMKHKQEYMKRRSFLLKMASTNVNLDIDDITSLLRNSPVSQAESRKSTASTGSETCSESSNAYDVEQLETMIESYIEQIKAKVSRMKHIINWIVNETNMSDLNLPYGLSKNLKIPTEIEKLETATTIGGIPGTFDDSLMQFIESSIDNFLLLDGEYHIKLEQLSTKIHEITQHFLNEENGWTLNETAVLYYITCTSGIGTDVPAPAAASDPEPYEYGHPLLRKSSTSSSQVTINLIQSELCSRLFPKKSQESIINQKYAIKYKKMFEVKCGTIINDWNFDKNELTNKINAGWQQLTKKHLIQVETKLRLRKQKELCTQWSNIVDDLRRNKCEKIRQLQLLIEPLRKKAEEELRVQKELEAKRRLEIHKNVTKYKSEKERWKLQQLFQKESESQLLEEMKRVRQKVNKPRVEFRRYETSMKEISKIEAKKVKEQEILARAARLESIKKPVEIDYEPWNVISDTHASAVRRYETLQQLESFDSDEQQVQRFFHQYYSFTSEKLLKDRRLRLEMKLRDAGLLESSYARQVLNSMQPKPKPHLKTQIKFDHE